LLDGARFGIVFALGFDQTRKRRDLAGARFGQDHAQHACIVHQADSRHRIGQSEDAEQFHRHAFAADAFQRFGQFAAGRQCPVFGLASEARLEAEIAQDAQVIFANALARIADKAHPARLQIGQPAEEIGDLQRFWMGIERVDGEIAPCRILAPVVGEGDRRAASIGADVAAQRGDLDRAGFENGRNGAVLDPGRHGTDTGVAAQIDHLFGPMERRAIDIGHGDAEQRVAHRAADPAHRVGPERRGKLRKIGALGPGGGGEIGHCVASIHSRRRDRL
jgi:hypothetical protein